MSQEKGKKKPLTPLGVLNIMVLGEDPDNYDFDYPIMEKTKKMVFRERARGAEVRDGKMGNLLNINRKPKVWN